MNFFRHSKCSLVNKSLIVFIFFLVSFCINMAIGVFGKIKILDAKTALTKTQSASGTIWATPSSPIIKPGENGGVSTIFWNTEGITMPYVQIRIGRNNKLFATRRANTTQSAKTGPWIGEGGITFRLYPADGQGQDANLGALLAELTIKAEKAPDLNIIYIMMDDLGYRDLGCYGSNFIKTPHIDQFAQEGMRLTQYYTNGSVCSPTRASILTGHYPAALGYFRVADFGELGITPDITTVPQMLRDNGYTTGHVGKWHVGFVKKPFNPKRLGFDESVRLKTFHTHVNPSVKINEEDDFIQTEGYSSSVLTDFALDFIENHAHDEKPFFLNLWYYAPHIPLEAPSHWLDQYPDTNEGKFAAMVSYTDEEIGRLLRKLDDLGIADKTLIIITSDNGGTQRGTHPNGNGELRGFKNMYFEGGIRVPFIIRWPGHVPENTDNDSVVLSFDLMPTVLELVGIDKPGSLEGRSFLDIVLNNQIHFREEILFWLGLNKDFFQPQSGIIKSFAARWKDWKLVFHDQKTYLFDISQDISEKKNLIKSYPYIAEKLWNEYRVWRKKATQIQHKEGSITGQVTKLSDKEHLFENGLVTLAFDDRFDFITKGEFTIQFDFVPMNIGTRQMIIRKEATWELILEENGELSAILYGADNPDTPVMLKSRTILQENKKYNIALTVQGWWFSNNTIKLYVNGHLEAEDNDIRVLNRIYWRYERYSIEIGNTSDLTLPLKGIVKNLDLYILNLIQPEIQGSFPPILWEESDPLLVYRNTFEREEDFMVGRNPNNWKFWTNGNGRNGTVERYLTSDHKNWTLRMHTFDIDKSTNYPGLYALSPKIPIEPNHRYRLKAYVRNANFKGWTSVRTFNNQNEVIQFYRRWFRRDAWEYNEDRLKFETSPDTKYLQLRFRLIDSNAFVDIDSIVLEKI